MASKATEATTPVVADEDVTAEGIVTGAVELYEGDSTTTDNSLSIIEGFKTGNAPIHSSFRGDDFFEVAKAQLGAMSNSKPLADHLGTTIQLDNYVLQAVEIPDTETGEIHKSVRVTLSDSTNGVSYHASSVALAQGLQGIVNALQGKEPHEWPAPLPVKVIEERTRKGFRFMKIVVVL